MRADLLAFDRVTIDRDGAAVDLSIDEFLRIPLDERIRLNFSRKLRFTKNGGVVDAGDALRSLMAAARQ